MTAARSRAQSRALCALVHRRARIGMDNQGEDEYWVLTVDIELQVPVN
jgi:hypothetical protein